MEGQNEIWVTGNYLNTEYWTVVRSFFLNQINVVFLTLRKKKEKEGEEEKEGEDEKEKNEGEWEESEDSEKYEKSNTRQRKNTILVNFCANSDGC